MEDLENFLQDVMPVHVDSGILAFVNPYAADRPTAGYLRLIVGLIALTVVCAGLMIYTIYYISTVKNVARYGQLKLIGVTSAQIRSIIRRHARRQYLTGLPIGCLLGAGFGYALMPLLAYYRGIEGDCKFTVKPLYFVCAAVLSYVIVHIGVRKPMRILSKTPPIHAASFTGSPKIHMGKVRSARFTPGRFARKNIRRRRKNTTLVAVSMSIVVLLFVITANIVHSLDFDSLLSMLNLMADIEIGAEDFLYGLEVGQTSVTSDAAIPDAIHDKLEPVAEKAKIVYHYQLSVPVFLEGERAKRYCEAVLDGENYQKNVADDKWLSDVMVGRAKRYRETGKPIGLTDDYRFYDYDQMAEFPVFEGSLDREKFESGAYVLVVALDKDGTSVYHAGDVVTLYDEFPEESEYSFEQNADGSFPYFDSLRKKEYTVMAVVGDAYRNQMAGGDENSVGFEYILPTQLMAKFDRTPDLFLVTINAPDTETLAQAELAVQKCVEEMSGEADIFYRSKGFYRANLDRFAMMLRLFGNGLAIMVGVMALANFLNSAVSGIAERKAEFSTLQAIGMMKRLLLKILRLENLYTVLLAVIPGYLLGHSLSVLAIRKLSESIPYLKCRLTLLPGLILAAIIGVLSMLYPNRQTDIGDSRRKQ